MPKASHKQTHSPEETRLLGENIGRRLRPGAVLGLTGDLGSGKTAFIQGLARGLGVAEQWYVTSPSYTLLNIYPGRRLNLYHVDLYRLGDISEMDALGLDDVLGRREVVAMEWADKFGPGLWPESLTISFTITGETSRRIFLAARDETSRTLLTDLAGFAGEVEENQ